MTRIPKFLFFVLLAGLNGHTLFAREVAIEADVSRTGEPIHPFVYGQFIEHLGRCIYGGIWAEMLEDRKFYFPVTPDYNPYGNAAGEAYPVVSASPWQISGSPEGVEMDEEDSFVGDHTPRIQEGSGIRQNDLGVKSGETYKGYFWAKAPSAHVRVTFGVGNQSESRTFRVRRSRYEKFEYSFKAPLDTDKAFLEIQVESGEAHIGTVSLMPADNIRGMRADTVALLKELNAPIYRWPGGNFVSGYEWRDGIGDRDRRPPRRNPAWTGVEHNDFGTDEFIDFCREINTEPAIAVNTGFGDPHTAAEWVAYCNDKSGSHAADMRRENGNRDPYNVKYWCVGNEMFGTWQLGYMQLHHYTEKHNRTARAMWEVDDTLTLIGVGAIGGINADHDPTAAKANRGWSRGMLEASSKYMTWISEHFYDGRTPWSEKGVLPVKEHVQLMKNNIRRIVDRHRALQASVSQLNGRTVPIAMDEWNYWHRDYYYGELGCIY
ncbi:MAG: alpha-N-arabinofuranosidase, partial [Verrucomicrobiae bacterium]|nr:alpha-N-arabinofuranosidase [Verrucomicrobiae bacterium]